MAGIRNEDRSAQAWLNMTGQNHYKILGVAPDADLSQIRAAYVRLLKRYHPDHATESEMAENGAEIQRIVGAYRTLKDPRTRAAYDATTRRIMSAKPDPQPAPARTGTVLRARRRFKVDTDTISYAFMLFVGAVGLHLLVSRLVQLRRPNSTGPALTSSVREAAGRIQLEAAVRNAGMMSAPEARNYSSRCFAAARHTSNSVAADPCVSFDMAYVYWRDTMGGPLLIDPYFQPDAISSRANAAFSALKSIGAAARIQSIRAATLRTIMQTPSATDEFTLVSSGPQAGYKPTSATPDHGPPSQED